MLSLAALTSALPRNAPRSTPKGFGAAARPAPGRGSRRSKAVLPAGTVVKHGTTSDVLKQILREGVRPSGSVSAGFTRDMFEVRPTSDAVYVSSSYVAYAAALISFTSKMCIQVTSGFSLDRDLVPLPVVLNIRLQEDCVLDAISKLQSVAAPSTPHAETAGVDEFLRKVILPSEIF